MLWKPVVDWEGMYAVSDEGDFRSLERVVIRRNGLPCSVRERFLKPRPIPPMGYLAVTLRGPGRKVGLLVHRAVLEAFVGPCPEGMECRHFPDRDPTNNRLTNLSWGTRDENTEDRVFHESEPRGTERPNAKLTEADIPGIRAMVARGESQSSVASLFGVNNVTIWQVIHGRTWTHV